jgi:hypothetical protein
LGWWLRSGFMLGCLIFLLLWSNNIILLLSLWLRFLILLSFI